MKKVLGMLLTLSLLLTPLLTACGTKDEPGETPGETPVETPGEEEPGEEPAEEKYKVGILAPAVTHGWVAAVAYNAELRAKELSDKIEYQIQTSSNAEEMTAQLDDLLTWGAQAIVAFPQWEGMEVPMQQAIDDGVTVVNFDIEIAADGVYRVAGDNEDMGVQG